MSHSDSFALLFRFMSFSSSLFEELLQSYDATYSACSAIDRLRKENNKQVIFSNVNDDDNDNINYTAQFGHKDTIPRKQNQ